MQTGLVVSLLSSVLAVFLFSFPAATTVLVAPAKPTMARIQLGSFQFSQPPVRSLRQWEGPTVFNPSELLRSLQVASRTYFHDPLIKTLR